MLASGPAPDRCDLCVCLCVVLVFYAKLAAV